jgi:hypothetical protein
MTTNASTAAAADQWRDAGRNMMFSFTLCAFLPSFSHKPSLYFCFQIALDTSYWTVFNHIMIWGSLIWYFVLQYFYNYVIGGRYVGSLSKVSPYICIL